MVTATTVQELRQQTGAKMMDCKNALVACDGNFDQAITWIKKKNLAAGTSTFTKPANEGLLAVCEDSAGLTIMEMSASTDFATKSDDFVKFLKMAVEAAHCRKVDSAEAITNFLVGGVQELAGKIGENIAIKRVARLEGNYGYYMHFDAKQAAAVVLEDVTPEQAQKVGKDIAMHIVFAKPDYLTRDDVPAEAVEKQKKLIAERLADDPKNAKKPPIILDKIAKGMMDAFYAESVLMEQPYYKDGKMSLVDVIGNVKVKRFVRFKVGESK
jgi:elongation factor Ts